jgi:hypothetical protein
MEVETTGPNKIELLKTLKSKINSNDGYEDVLENLINIYSAAEKREGFNSNQATCLIMLLCLTGNYEKANSKRSIYKVS